MSVLRQQWSVYCLGSSTAVYGVIAATCLLHPTTKIKVFGYELPINSLGALGALVAFELASTRNPRVTSTVDLNGHFGGLLAGALAAFLVRWEAGQQLMTWQTPTQSDEELSPVDKERT